jgi:hypothetical protein
LPTPCKVYVNNDFYGQSNASQVIFTTFSQSRRIPNGLHDIFPLKKRVINQQFLNAFPNAYLGHNPAYWNPQTPNTGFASHDGGISGNSVKFPGIFRFHTTNIHQRQPPDKADKGLCGKGVLHKKKWNTAMKRDRFLTNNTNGHALRASDPRRRHRLRGRSRTRWRHPGLLRGCHLQ